MPALGSSLGIERIRCPDVVDLRATDASGITYTVQSPVVIHNAGLFARAMVRAAYLQYNVPGLVVIAGEADL